MPSGHSALREGLWRGGEESQEIARAPRRYPTRCDERSRTEPSPRPAREPAHECAHPSDLSREIATPSSPDTPPHVGRTSGDSCGISAGPHCGGFCRRDIALPGRLLDLWAYHHGVQIDFSRPGKSTDNCVIETFTGSLRDERLNVALVRVARGSQGEARGLATGLQTAENQRWLWSGKSKHFTHPGTLTWIGPKNQSTAGTRDAGGGQRSGLVGMGGLLWLALPLVGLHLSVMAVWRLGDRGCPSGGSCHDLRRVRVWRGPGVGNCPGLLGSGVFVRERNL